MKAGAVLDPLSDRFAGDDNAVTPEDSQMVEDLTEEIRDAIRKYEVSLDPSVGSRVLVLRYCGVVFTTGGHLRAGS